MAERKKKLLSNQYGFLIKRKELYILITGVVLINILANVLISALFQLETNWTIAALSGLVILMSVIVAVILLSAGGPGQVRSQGSRKNVYLLVRP